MNEFPTSQRNKKKEEKEAIVDEISGNFSSGLSSIKTINFATLNYGKSSSDLFNNLIVNYSGSGPNSVNSAFFASRR